MSADGGNGASLCSNNGKPDGVVSPYPDATWDSPGEVISLIARYFGGVRPDEGAPGQLVVLLCNPTMPPLAP